MNTQKPAADVKSAAQTSGTSPLAVKVLLALGGFAGLAIALEGARTWSWWASAVLTSWNIGGLPAAPELFIYPAFFTMVLALSRPEPRAVTARFLTAGMVWSAALFLADPALRTLIQSVAPMSAEASGAATLRGTALYGLLFAWMYLTYRQLVPRAAAEVGGSKKGTGPEPAVKATDKAGGAISSDGEAR